MNKLSKIELIELVTKICLCHYSSEEAYDAALDCFLANVPDPEAANLIFRHKPELTPEEIVEKALAYKPIILPPPDDMIQSNSK